METNHAFISYEAELKTQRGEIMDLKRKLKDATTLVETERETADKTQKKLDKLKKKLNEKGAETVQLKEELELARQSREGVEKEIKDKLFDKVQARCELVKDLLTQFRYGPALQANFFGQTKNNLSLVRSLLSKNPSDLKEALEEEKTELKKDMRQYWKAPKEYERAFNRLIRILSFEGGEFGEDETEQVEEEVEEYKDDSETDEEGANGEGDQEMDEQGKVQEVDDKEEDPEVGHQIGEDLEAGGQVVVDSEDQVDPEASLSKARSLELATHEEDPASLDVVPPSE